MIVPSTRFLVWFAILALPFATLAGAVESARPIAFAALALFTVVAGADIAFSCRKLRGVDVHLPELIRATHDRTFSITVRIRNANLQARSIRIALATPPELALTTDEMVVTIPSGTEWSLFEWTCVAHRRGRFVIHSARVEGMSRLRLWKIWKTSPVSSEVRIYPNLIRERSHLAALFLNRGGFGTHAQRQVGRGREFEKLRDYNSGDSIQDVHWKATAKRGLPVTKVGSSRVDLQACKLEYSIVSPK